MRKVIAIVAIATLAACGGAKSTTPTTDSAVIKTDSASVTTDTTAPKANVDSVSK